MRIGREIAEGLDAAHAKGLIHRDIKPGNIWLETRGAMSGGGVSGKSAEHHSPITTHYSPTRVKILDFGLARAASQQDSGLTQQGAIVGTPAYMAPEQARGETVDGRCDLFSLGIVLYRLCSGQMPFRGEDTVSTLMAVAMHEPVAPSKLNAEVPDDLSNLIMKLLEKDPVRRPAAAADLVLTLRSLETRLTNLDVAKPQGEVLRASPPRPPRRKAALIAGFAAAAAPYRRRHRLLLAHSRRRHPRRV